MFYTNPHDIYAASRMIVRMDEHKQEQREEVWHKMNVLRTYSKNVKVRESAAAYQMQWGEWDVLFNAHLLWDLYANTVA